MSTNNILPHIDAWLDGELGQADQFRLKEWLLSSPSHMEQFVRHSFLHAQLAEQFSPANVESNSEPKLTNKTPIRPRRHSRRARAGNNHAYRHVAAAILMIAALTGVVLWISNHRRPSPVLGPVAHIQEAEFVRWGNTDQPCEVGSSLKAGRMKLVAGMIRLRMKTGAEVLLEAPADMELQRANRIRLNSGALTVFCPKQAHGFEVQTPEALFTDLGTRFGVLVESGQVEAHVFEGEIQAKVAKADHASNYSAGRGVNITASGDVRAIKSRPEKFLQEIPIPLDVTDMICGGDGLGRAYERGISPTTGKAIQKFKHPYTAGGESSPVPWNKMVDRVFVTHGKTPVVIDSRGTICKALPQTMVPASSGFWCGRKIWVPDTEILNTQIDDVDYGTAGHRLLWTHSNKGITFDLDAIGRHHSGRKPIRFTTVVGNQEESRRLETINATMRVEIQSDDKFKSYWRPFFGYVLALSWGFMMFAVTYLIFSEPEKVDKVINSFASMGMMWSVALGVLGVQISSRSKDKQVANGLTPSPGIMSAIVARVAGIKK